MQVIKYLLPFIMTTSLLATFEKNTVGTAKKSVRWQSFKQQGSGLSPKEFAKLVKAKKDLSKGEFTAKSLVAMQVNVEQCKCACISYSIQLQKNTIDVSSNPTMTDVVKALIVRPTLKKDSVVVLADALSHLDCADKK